MSKAAELAALIGSGQAQGDKNLIINGGMQVAQRGTSAATQTTLAYHTVDRFKIGPSNMGTFTHTQESDGPDGFSKSVKLVCTTADASPAAADNITIQNIIEAQNLQHLSKGSSDAKSVTLSFYAKSNKTGTYTAEIFDGDNNRHISKTFTVSSSGTWEYKTITFVGDTSGALNNDNGVGFYVLWHLGAGSNFTSGTLATSWQAQDDTDRVSSSNVNLADTVGNYFQLTGVSLEIGDVATPFENESFASTLQKCQRYYTTSGFNSGTSYGGGGIAMYAFTTSEAGGTVIFPTTMRAGPTIRTKDASGNIGGIHRAGGPGDVTSGVAVQWSVNAESDKVGFSGLTKSSAWAVGNMLIGVWDATAEL